MEKLLFGTAGVPISAKEHSSQAGIIRVGELGLGCMELEFVHGVRMGDETASEVSSARKKAGITMTAHGPYYVNLNAKEPEKLRASANRILETARVLKKCGGWSCTFHAAFYLGMPPENVYLAVKKQLEGIVSTLKSEKNDVWLRPETTGKPSQFGSLDEILRLSSEIDQVLPCVDFAHLHSRSGGKENSAAEFRSTLEKIEKSLGHEALKNMHIHFSGINYSKKGELNHLTLEESDLKYKELLSAWKEFNISGCAISESPNIEGDAMLMRGLYQKL
ncbi:MAG: TIM barrel protein [archaeon]